MSNVFIICRAKRRGNSSWMLERALEEAGVSAYRVTPHRIPLRSRDWSATYINYGCSQRPVWWDDIPRLDRMFNTFNTVRASSRKPLMQNYFAEFGVPCLDFTRSLERAQQWAEEDTVVCRTLTRASRGRGIVLAHSPDEIVESGLYTKLFTGHRVREYRVYIVAEKAVDITEKRRRGRGWCEEHGVDRDSEWTNVVRSHGNGWVFARNTFEASEEERARIMQVAEDAAHSIQLGFGAVDMIVSRDEETGELNDIRAVETNTSVGLEPTATTTRLLAEAVAREVA